MAASPREIDVMALKAQRAALRRRQLSLKREEYRRTRATSPEPGPQAAAAAASVKASAAHSDASKVKPHRMVRTAIRGRLAKGMLETTADVPTLLAMGHPWKHVARKPSVARGLACMRSDASDEGPNCCSQEYLDWFMHSAEMQQKYLEKHPALCLAQAAVHSANTDPDPSKLFATCGVSEAETTAPVGSSDADSGTAVLRGEDSDFSLSPPAGPAASVLLLPAAGKAFQSMAPVEAPAMTAVCTPGAGEVPRASVEVDAAPRVPDPLGAVDFVEGEEDGWEFLPPPAVALEEGAAGWSMVA